MNLSTRLVSRPSAEGRGLFSAIAAGEQLGGRPALDLGTSMALRIRKLGLTVLTTAALCSTIGHLVAADPSVEVFTQDSVVTQDSTVTSTGSGGLTILPQRPFRLSGTITSGYDDNVGTSTGGAGSATTQADFTISKDLYTPRTQLSITMRTSVVYYLDQATSRGTDVTGSINASLTHSVSPRLSLTASIAVAYLKEPEFSTDLEPARRGTYFRTSDTLTASYALSPRLSTTSSYQLGELVTYEGASLSFGDRTEHTFGESVRFSLSPRTTLITDYRFGLVEYNSAPKSSSTHTALAGLDYQINSRLSATFRGGATFRKYDDAGNGDRTDPSASASLTYIVGPSTNLNWTASYSIEEPNFAEALSRTTFRTGLQLGYQFTRRLTGQLALNYNHDQNTGLLIPGFPFFGQQTFIDDTVALTLGANYTLTSRVALTFGFTHTELNSDRPTGGYSRNRYTAGFSFNF